MTGLDADLATLRNPRAHWMDRAAATNRVEAELSRLREERDAARRIASMGNYGAGVAAEAECARLRQALGAYRSALRSGEPESERLRQMGDEALARPDKEEP